MPTIDLHTNPQPATYYQVATLPSTKFESQNTFNQSTTSRPPQQRVSRNNRYDNPNDAAYGAPLNSSPIPPLLFGILWVLFIKILKNKFRRTQKTPCRFPTPST